MVHCHNEAVCTLVCFILKFMTFLKEICIRVVGLKVLYGLEKWI